MTDDLKYTFPENFPVVAQCVACGRVFGATRKSALYCCAACKQAAYRAKRSGDDLHHERIGERGDASVCSQCGRLMYLNVGSTRQYCTDACRQAAYRERILSNERS